MDHAHNLRSAPCENEGRIRFSGTFASPVMESAFRQRHFRDERWLSCFLVLAAMLRVSLMLLADYQHFGVGPAFWPLLACRSLFLLVSALLFFALRRAVSPTTADQLFLGWSLLLGGLTVYALSARPPENSELLLMSFVVVLVTYCLTPLPLSRQAALALIFSAAGLFVSLRTDGATVLMVGVAYAMSNFVGSVTSWRLNHRRRQEFLGVLREAELRARLEKALAEISTLEGRLCICAWCKRIRDKVEAWQSVETFVQNRTHATFTHGICPDCLESQARDVVPSYP